MIFIGPELSDPHAHFVTNVVSCMGTADDLIIDLYRMAGWKEIRDCIAEHLKFHDERYVIYNAYEDEDFFIYLKRCFPELRLITVFSDDEWRHANYDRYLAKYSDVFTITVKGNIERYKKYGLKPFYMQWACNPKMFYPLLDQSKDIDVSFIGAPYGKRLVYVRFLIANGINIQIYGKDWERFADIRPYCGGFLSHTERLAVISRSKINLNFLWTSAEEDHCTIKGRTLELSACCAFQIANHTDEFSTLGFVDGESVAVFNDQCEMLAKVKYYLTHEEERETIAQKAYTHVLQNHTWRQRFQKIFEKFTYLTSLSRPVLNRFRIMVILEKGVLHQITLGDNRLDLIIIDSEHDWQTGANEMDGVIHLGRDSTLNNETLYMMAFALVIDKSDMVAANFYVDSEKNRTWIRFRDRLLEKKRKLLSVLPRECIMFSGKYARKHGCVLSTDTREYKVSYIEYPFFEIILSYFLVRKLKLYFAHHRNPRQRLSEYMCGLKWGKALSLGVGKVWQKSLLR